MHCPGMILGLLLSWLLVPACGVETLHSTIDWCHPFSQALSENDDQQRRPLKDALEKCFTAVEFDVWYQDGELRVGPDRDKLRPGRTLESVYLEPLAKKFSRQGGLRCLLPECYPVSLVVDIRSEPTATWEALRRTLASYSHLFFSDKRFIFAAQQAWTGSSPGEGQIVGDEPLSLLIAGRWPRTKMERDLNGLFRLEGRRDDLILSGADQWVVQISEDWPEAFNWNGKGSMPDQEQNRLVTIVERIHREGRSLRFAATPDREAVWQELTEAGVDVIGTENLRALELFLHKQKGD